MNDEFLFLPENVENILQNYPVLSRKMSSPYKEGQRSSAFPKARKSQRQIYRILANQHYPHLVELLQTLEYCLSKGYQNPAVLRTRNQSQISSAISELLVAHYLIINGFDVLGYDQLKNQKSIPDILATKKGISLVVEVYQPRDWEGLGLFLDDIVYYLKYIDRPLDYVCNIDNKLIRNFDKAGRLLSFNPWTFSEAMVNRNYRMKRIRKIISYIDDNLNDLCPKKLATQFLYDEFNIKTTLKIKGIISSKNTYPSRFCFFSNPTLAGYAPAGMFDLLVRKRILSKLEKKQLYTVSGDHIRMLIVDITCLGCWSEFEYPIYLSKFKESLQKYLSDNSVQADLIAFCTPRVKSRGGLTVDLVFKKKNIAEGILHKILGEISGEIIV